MILNAQPIFQHVLLQELEDVNQELLVLHINLLFTANLTQQEHHVSGIQLF
jgi:hypothetical protein